MRLHWICDNNLIHCKYQPSCKKTNIVDSAWSIEPVQPKHAAQVYPDRHFSPTADFLFQESLLYTSIPLMRNVLARIWLRGLRRLIWVNTLRRGHNVVFLAGRLLCVLCTGAVWLDHFGILTVKRAVCGNSVLLLPVYVRNDVNIFCPENYIHFLL